MEIGEYTVTETNTAIKAKDGSDYTYTFVDNKSTTTAAPKVEKGKTAKKSINIIGVKISFGFSKIIKRKIYSIVKIEIENTSKLYTKLPNKL